MGDVVSREEQGIAFGLYTTAMGLGFGVGPLVGAAVAVGFGIAASYGVASALALVGAGVALKGLRPVRPAQTGSLTRRAGFTWGAVGPLLRNPHLVAGNLASLLMSASFSAITNFFPIYAAESHASQAAINSMFSARSFGSALARLPSGTITSRLPSRWVMFAALLIETVVVAGMAQTNALVLLGVLLVIEGIAFGIFLPSGQALIIEQSTAETRGQIIGIYSTAGSLGSMVGPLGFGVIAEVFGVAAVFRVTSGLILLGLLVIGCLYVRKRPAPGVRVTGVG
ncbi:MAG: MFS transporter [Chloroflexi bacterium]|nr:MFS transporter [Chloroflexota bacterium]